MNVTLAIFINVYCISYGESERERRTQRRRARSRGPTPRGGHKARDKSPSTDEKRSAEGQTLEGSRKARDKSPSTKEKRREQGQAPQGLHIILYRLYIIYQGIRISMDQNINVSGYHVSICTMHLSLAPKSRTSKY